MERKVFLKYLGLVGLGLVTPWTKKSPSVSSRVIDPCQYYDAEYTYDSSLRKHMLTKVTFVKGFNKLPISKLQLVKGAISQTLEPGRRYYPEISYRR